MTDKAEEATESTLTPRPTRRKARAGLFFREETKFVEPSDKRAIAFVDGQNLFRCAKTAFGYTYPNYDVQSLAEDGNGLERAFIRVFQTQPTRPDGITSGRGNSFK